MTPESILDIKQQKIVDNEVRHNRFKTSRVLELGGKALQYVLSPLLAFNLIAEDQKFKAEDLADSKRIFYAGIGAALMLGSYFGGRYLKKRQHGNRVSLAQRTVKESRAEPPIPSPKWATDFLETHKIALPEAA